MPFTRWAASKSEQGEAAQVIKDKATGEPSSGSVDRHQNHLYFYSEVSDDSVLKLIKSVREAETELKKQAIDLGLVSPLPIILHVHSYGGSLIAGFAAMDAILGLTVPVHTVVEGACASAATLITIVGSKRIIRPNSFMLIHQLSSITWGKHSEMKDEITNLDLFMATVKRAYTKHTKIPPKKIEEILRHDLFFDAKACVTLGLADEVSL